MANAAGRAPENPSWFLRRRPDRCVRSPADSRFSGAPTAIALVARRKSARVRPRLAARCRSRGSSFVLESSIYRRHEPDGGRRVPPRSECLPRMGTESGPRGDVPYEDLWELGLITACSRRPCAPPLTLSVRRHLAKICGQPLVLSLSQSGLMKVRNVLKLLREDGWIEIARRASRRQLKHPTRKSRVTVSGKLSDELAPGTHNSILPRR